MRSSINKETWKVKERKGLAAFTEHASNKFSGKVVSQSFNETKKGKPFCFGGNLVEQSCQRNVEGWRVGEKYITGRHNFSPTRKQRPKTQE